MATKVIALNTVVRTVTPGKAATKDTAAVRPKIDTLAPRTIFVIDDDDKKNPDSELSTLLRLGAVSTEIPNANQVYQQPLAPVTDGPGVVVVKDDDSPFKEGEQEKLVARGKELDVAGIGGASSWKPATLRRKVSEAEAAAAAADANAGGNNDLI